MHTNTHGAAYCHKYCDIFFSHSTSSTCITLFQFICSVANVMFLETAITVEESAGFMTVCINISGGIPDTTIVRLSTVASSATGKLLSN